MFIMLSKCIYHFLHALLYSISKILFRYKASGSEHIPKKGSAILASNHSSYLDPPFVGMGVPRRINYLAKKELFSNFFLDCTLKNICGAIPVDREQLDRNTLKKIYQLLNDNEIILMFPEGTRSFNGSFLEPKLGIGMIAYATRAPVIPVYVHGSKDILGRDSTRIHFKPCAVFFGPPVDLDSYYSQKKSKELYQEISMKIMEGIRKLKESVTHQDRENSRQCSLINRTSHDRNRQLTTGK